MMRIASLSTLLLALLVTAPAAAQNGSGSTVPFRPGERLAYTVEYGRVPAGSMEIRIEGLETYRERPAYHIVFEAATNRAISFVYELDTLEESYFDAERFHSLYYRRTGTENDRDRAKEYSFDQENQLRIEIGGDTVPTSPNAVDQLAMMYYLRMIPLDQGAKYRLTNQADPDDNPLTIKVSKRERIKVPAGTYDTVLLELDLQTDSGMFKKGGKNRVWVTDNARRIPVKVSTKLGLGSFTAELVEFTRGATDAALR